MPLYEFLDEKDGSQVGLWFELGEAPSIGDTLEHEGRTLRRLPPTMGRPVDHDAASTHVSDQLPLNWKYASRFDKEGRPVFNSAQEIREALARAKDGGDTNVSWGRELPNRPVKGR